MAIVIKYGGNAMTEVTTRRAVATEIARLAAQGEAPIVVHGGGPFIAAALDEAGLEHRFVRGLRVTSVEALPLVERALTLLGKTLAQEIGAAVGLTGRDARLLRAVPAGPDLGRVGRMSRVDTTVLDALLAAGLTPVVASLAVDDGGDGLNVNADEVAGAVAGACGAPAVFLSDVPGVLDDPADPTSLLSSLRRGEIEARVGDGRIGGGMIPKVEAALSALDLGASYAVIADGRRPEALAEVLAGQAGTRILVG